MADSPYFKMPLQLPKYITEAIASERATTGNYALLSPEQWTELAEHIYDEMDPESENRPSFLPPGYLKQFRRFGRIESILDGILIAAVYEHSGPPYHPVPHKTIARRIYFLDKLRNSLPIVTPSIQLCTKA